MKPLGRGCKGNSESLTSPLPHSSHTPSPAATPPHVLMGHHLHPQVTTEPLIGSPKGNHTRNARLLSKSAPHRHTHNSQSHTWPGITHHTYAYNKRQLPHTISYAQFHFKRPYTRCYAHTPINCIHSDARTSKTRSHVSPVPPPKLSHPQIAQSPLCAPEHSTPATRDTHAPLARPPFLAPPHLWGPR